MMPPSHGYFKDGSFSGIRAHKLSMDFPRKTPWGELATNCCALHFQGGSLEKQAKNTSGKKDNGRGSWSIPPKMAGQSSQKAVCAGPKRRLRRSSSWK